MADLDDKLRQFEKKFGKRDGTDEARQEGTALGTRIGFELLIFTGLFGWGGYMLDARLGTMPAFMLLFIFLGLGVAIYNAWRLMNRNEGPASLKKGNKNGPENHS